MRSTCFLIATNDACESCTVEAPIRADAFVSSAICETRCALSAIWRDVASSSLIVVEISFIAIDCSRAPVACWVAGFDILYSLQDESFDRARGLHSIPVRFGIRGSLILSGLLHLVTLAALVAVHLHAGLGPWHALGLALVAAILVYEHAIVTPGDLSRINRAFFDLNGYISLAYLACVLVDLWRA